MDAYSIVPVCPDLGCASTAMPSSTNSRLCECSYHSIDTLFVRERSAYTCTSLLLLKYQDSPLEDHVFQVSGLL